MDSSTIHLAGNEFGIDSVAILVQGNHVSDPDAVSEILESIQNPNVDFVFIQSKTSPSFYYGEMAKFFSGILSFFEGNFPDISDQLADLSAAKDITYERAASRRNPTIRAFFVATGTYQSSALLEQLIPASRQKLLEMNIFDSATISMICAGELQKCFRTASSAAETAIHFDRCESLPSHSKVEQSFIGYISAKELSKVITSGTEQTKRSR